MHRLPVRSLVLMLFEATLIVAAICVAAYIRLGDFTWLLSERENGILKTLLIAGVMQGSLYYAGLYDLHLVSDRREQFIRIMQALGVASLILAGIYFWFPDLPIGRGVAVMAAVFVLTFVIGWRLLLDFFSRRAWRPEIQDT
jgi:FlaA1/EpsC-like NDP-sugar epimerase